MESVLYEFVLLQRHQIYYVGFVSKVVVVKLLYSLINFNL
jgi:hypothetical protein